MNRRLPLLLAAFALSGSAMLAAPPAAAPKPELGAWGVNLTAMDTHVKPGDNFFSYVNGNWVKTAVIPPDRSNTGSFQMLQVLSEKRMREIVSSLEAKPADQLTPDERKLRDLYDAFMDEKQIEKNGLKPVRADLKAIAALKTHKQVARMMGSIRLATYSVYNLGIGVDDKNPNAYSVDLRASGLGLPDRDYYLLDNKGIVKARDAYKAYLVKMLTLAGIKHAKSRAAAVFALETRIAKAEWPRSERRNRDKTYNPMTYDALKTLAPKFPWDAFFADTQIPLKGGKRQVIVAEKSAFPVLAQIFAATPVHVWRDYLTIHYLHSYAPYLPKRFDEADFAFYGTVLGGRSQQLPRATRGVHLLDRRLGEALGKLYVARYFPPIAKTKAKELVTNLLRAYAEDIQTLDWMSAATKKKALEKIHDFTPKIGYPDHWRDYSAYKVTRDDLIGDVQRGHLFDWAHDVVRLDSPVDKTEWGMTPQTVNAYYNPSFNEIVFPAAILQPPFFDPNADDAVNYGGIGAVIGHEISHGFDDQGSKYDGTGAMVNWWTAQDRKNFKERTAMLVKQYDSYEPLPGMKIRGKQTLGENIADLAGLTIALKAYHISLDGKPAPVRDGFTGDQRFLLSFGQIWRSKFREHDLRNRILSDVHSPAMYRVIGATRNLDAWYSAFDVKPGDKYYLPPDKRVHLW